MLHVTLFYSALSPSFSLFRFYFCLVTFLLCIISLRFTLLYALLSSFSSALSFTLFVLCISPPLRSLYGLFYPTLLYFHSTIFPFALHCFVSLHYLASIYFISPCFPYFSWSSFQAPVLTSSLLGDIARPSIPCSTCFVEPRAILLPLIPLCSVSREPRALEKSEPD